MATGSPDWVSKPAHGSTELVNLSGTYDDGAILYSGQIALYPVLSVFTATAAGSPYSKFTATYYADSAHTEVAAIQSFVRGINTADSAQYQALAPFVEYKLATAGAASIDLSRFSIYGTYNRSGPLGIGGFSVPPYQINTSVAAGSPSTVLIPGVQPGPGLLYVQSAVAQWSLVVSYYDFTSGGFKPYFAVDNAVAGSGGSWPLPFPDAPCEVKVTNNGTTAHTVVAGWVCGSY